MEERLTPASHDLEARLAGVLEQDGITMSTPEGVHRRARRVKKTRTIAQPAPSIFFDADPLLIRPDEIADLDHASLGLLVRDADPLREQEIGIRNEPHARSEYVVSLAGVSLAVRRPRTEDRTLSGDSIAHNAILGRTREHAVYGTLHHDLMMEGYDPRDIAEQFTPDAFIDAYREAYGPLVRIRMVGVAIIESALSLVRRIERTEERVATEVSETIRIVETPRLVPIRAVLGFAALVLLVTLPAQAVVLARSAFKTRDAAQAAGNAGLADVQSIASSASISGSADSLKRASSRFREADALLTQSSSLALGIAAAMPSTYRSARALLELGDKASSAGQLLATGFEKIFADPSRRLDERLDVLSAYARGALPLLSDAARAAASVDISSIPAAQRDHVQELTKQIDASNAAVREFAALADFLSAAVGKDQAKRYLIVFQNQTELRPTGGFMGSLADVTFDRGEIKKMIVPPGGTYDLKGQLMAHIIAPKPLQLVNQEWQFQDANWSPDFPTAAAKLRWFWSKAGQPTVDGVIAVNASLLERILTITGPIDMPEYGKVIDSTNVMLEMQKAVELEYDKTANTPKKFVGDLAKALMERTKTFGKDQWLAAAQAVSDALTTKDVQVAMSNPDDEAFVERFGWSGQMKPTITDSLALIEANVAGQKTDGVVDEQVKHVATIRDDGSIVDDVTVQRTHRGTKGELFRGVRNVSYLRLYVPKGSRLISATGFQPPASSLFKSPTDGAVPDADQSVIEASSRPEQGIDVMTEGDRAVFGGWVQLDPGQTQTITYRYELPRTAFDLYSKLDVAPDAPTDATRAAYVLLLTSQSGKTNRTVDSHVTLPAGWGIAWSRGTTATDGALAMQGAWDRDQVIAALLVPPGVTLHQ